MLLKKKICAGFDGIEHEDYIFKNIDGKKYCKNCASRLSSYKGLKRQTEKQKEKLEIKKINTVNLHKLFLRIWEKRADNRGNCTCFESGVLLDKHYFKENSCCYSHILAKSKYPQYAFAEWNIQIVHPDRHQDYETNEDKAPNQRDYKKELLSNILNV